MGELVITSTEETITKHMIDETNGRWIPKDAKFLLPYGATVGRLQDLELMQ